MFSALRSRMSYANVVATLALVFAMSGGALAASKYLITSTKQIKPNVLASLKGKSGTNGAPGAQGPAGPAGSAGPAGLVGAKGEAGTAGKEGPAGPMGPTGKNGAPGAAGSLGPTGPAGVAGPTGPEGVCSTSKCALPGGVTETGAWSITALNMTPGIIATAPISFPVPLSQPSSNVFYCNQAETETPPATRECLNTITGAVEPAVHCQGSVMTPTASSATLCVYTSNLNSSFTPFRLGSLNLELEPSKEPDSRAGAALFFTTNFSGTNIAGWGSFAVTG